jgi:catechol 2,3-dioxygenase-like lactoylglutathione lyase family enzyme
VATEGGSGTPVPDLSIEVDDLTEVHRRMQIAGFTIEYGPVTEPWGVTRFYVRDPFGRLVNVWNISDEITANGPQSESQVDALA